MHMEENALTNVICLPSLLLPSFSINSEYIACSIGWELGKCTALRILASGSGRTPFSVMWPGWPLAETLHRLIFVKQRMSALTFVWAKMLIESLPRMVAGRGMVGFVNVQVEEMNVSEPLSLGGLVPGEHLDLMKGIQHKLLTILSVLLL